MKKFKSLLWGKTKKPQRPYPHTKVFEGALIIESLIKDYCNRTKKDQPGSWEIFTTDIIRYDTTDKRFEDGGDFGKEYLQDAKEHYITLHKDFENKNEVEILHKLHDLLLTIDKEMVMCDKKMKLYPK